MTKTKSTKRALLSSVLALFLCFAMLLGSTYAWFTDSVTSGSNVITSGTLDVDLVDAADNSMEGKVIDFVDMDANDLWEPGCTYSTEPVYVVNNGNLALKYNVVINGIEGDAKLLEAIEWTVTVDGTETALADLNGHLLAGDKSGKIVLTGHMKEDAGNEYMGLTASGISITVLATQYSYENDSNGSGYDENAPWMGTADTSWYNDTDTEFTISSAEELAGLAKLVNEGNSFAGKTITLDKDIDLNNVAWTPIGTDAHGFSGTFDGANHTVYNLNVSGDRSIGLFAYAAGVGNAIKNLKVENATVAAHDYAGAIIGRGYTHIDNCHVKNVTVTVTPYLNDDGVYDGGAKAGGIIGQMLEGGSTVTNCSATDVKIYGFRDIGGVVGMVHNTNSASGNTATNVTLGYVLFDQITANKNENAGAIYGRVVSSATVSPEKDSAENQNFKQVYAIYDAISACSLANYVNGGNSYAGKTVVMIDDIDLADINWTPIGMDGKRFQGTFDGQGYTIDNLTGLYEITDNYGKAFFGDCSGNVTIKNVTFTNASIANEAYPKGNIYGIVCGYSYGNITFENVHVKDSYLSGLGKVAPILAYSADPSDHTVTMENCSVTNTTIAGIYNVAPFIGLIQVGNTVNMTDCVATNNTWIANATGNYAKPYTTVNSEEYGEGIYWAYDEDGGYAAWGNAYTTYDSWYDNDGNEWQGYSVNGDYESPTIVYNVDNADTLSKALEAGGNVVLTNDIALTEAKMTAEVGNVNYAFMIVNGKTVTIDLNGHTFSANYTVADNITWDQATLVYVANGGSLTINDSVGTGKMTFNTNIPCDDYQSSWGVPVINRGTLVVNGGSIESLVPCPTVGPNGETDYTEYGIVSPAVDNFGALTLNGGTIYSVGHNAVRSNGTIVMNGGLMKSDMFVAVDVEENGKMTIHGGELDGGKTTSIIVRDEAILVVDGGFFNEKISPKNESILTVTGGTFCADPSTNVADGYVAVENANGTWTVTAE